MKTPPMPALSPAPGKVRGLALGLAVIEHLLAARSSQGVSQIARALGIAPSSAHDLLAVLAGLGFVEKLPDSHRYRLTPRIFRLVHEIAGHFGPNPKWGPLLPALAARHSASIYVHTLWDTEAVLIGAAGKLAPTTSLGVMTPVYASAAGIILTAQLPEDDWPRFAPGPAAIRPTPFTNTDPSVFLQNLRAARQNGFAIAERTAAPDLCAIAAPVPETLRPARYSVAFVFPSAEWPPQNLPDLKSSLSAAASELAAAL